MINKEILDYINSELNKGVPAETIKQNLSEKGGWSAQDISEAFAETEATFANNLPPRKPKERTLSKTFVAILIILIIVAIAAAAFLFYVKKNTISVNTTIGGNIQNVTQEEKSKASIMETENSESAISESLLLRASEISNYIFDRNYQALKSDTGDEFNQGQVVLIASSLQSQTALFAYMPQLSDTQTYNFDDGIMSPNAYFDTHAKAIQRFADDVSIRQVSKRDFSQENRTLLENLEVRYGKDLTILEYSWERLKEGLPALSENFYTDKDYLIFAPHPEDEWMLVGIIG